MIVEQTVEIPPSRQLLVKVPPEVPLGKVILTFTPAPANKDREYAEKIWTYNRTHPEEFKAKLQKLRGSLDNNSFLGLDGLEYQKKVREEWDK